MHGTQKQYFKLSFIIVLGVMFAGLLLQIASIPAITLSYPKNAIVLFFLSFLLVLSRFIIKDSFFFKWFSSIQNSLVSIIAFISLCLLMALIPQQYNENNGFLGLRNILNTHYFQFMYLYLLLTLGFVIVRRFDLGFTIRNIAFLLNHIGLWIILSAVGFGSFNFIKLDLITKYNSPVWYGFTSENKYKELPFALELKQFEVTFYLPKLQLIEIDSSDNVGVKVIKQWELDTLHEIKFKEKRISIKKYMPYTWWWNDSMLLIKTPGYVGSALVNIKDKNNEIEGWISYSSIMQKGKYLRIDEKQYLVLADPLPKEFTSTVKVYTSNGEIFQTDIKVNKPMKIMGWTIYQKDYHKEFREFSDYSVFEVNYDPWLWITYVGIFMLMIGSVLLIVLKK